MCRNIKTLYNFEPPATGEEIRAAALQTIGTEGSGRASVICISPLGRSKPASSGSNVAKCKDSSHVNYCALIPRV